MKFTTNSKVAYLSGPGHRDYGSQERRILRSIRRSLVRKTAHRAPSSSSDIQRLIEKLDQRISS